MRLDSTRAVLCASDAVSVAEYLRLFISRFTRRHSEFRWIFGRVHPYVHSASIHSSPASRAMGIPNAVAVAVPIASRCRAHTLANAATRAKAARGLCVCGLLCGQ